MIGAAIVRMMIMQMRRFGMFTVSMLVFALTTSLATAGQLVLQTAEVVAQQKALRADVEAHTGRFEKMPAAKQKQVLADQDRLFALLDGTRSTDELHEDKQTQVFNLVQSITDTLDGDADDERMVCRRESRTGSNMMTRVCRSQAQIREEKASGDYKMKEANRRICNDPSKTC